MLHQKIELTGALVIRLHGWSMMPAIWPRSRVRLVGVEFGEIQSGHVICYQIGQGIHCHRVIAVTGTGVFTQGDAFPPAKPEFVGPSAVIGRVDRVWMAGVQWNTETWAWTMWSKLSLTAGPWVRVIAGRLMGLPGVRPMVVRIMNFLEKPGV